jgi:hypothetical protein
VTGTEQLSMTALCVGITLSCLECGMTGVVLDGGVGADWPACHGGLRVTAPVPCAQRIVRADGDAMIAGRSYTDLTSGFVLCCTSGGRGPVTISGRTLQAYDRLEVVPGRGRHGLSRGLG